MTWTVDPATSLDDWVDREQPSPSLIFAVGVDWIRDLQKHGPFDDRVGALVMRDTMMGTCALQLTTVADGRLAALLWAHEPSRRITLLHVYTPPAEELP